MPSKFWRVFSPWDRQEGSSRVKSPARMVPFRIAGCCCCSFSAYLFLNNGWRRGERGKVWVRSKLWSFLPLFLKVQITPLMKSDDAGVRWLTQLLVQLGLWPSSPAPLGWDLKSVRFLAPWGSFFQQPLMNSCDGFTASLHVSFCSANSTSFRLGSVVCSVLYPWPKVSEFTCSGSKRKRWFLNLDPL